jgi:hypothetical protein
MEKLYNEKGQVAVAISYGYGAGWSTWEDISPLDKEFNELILNKDWKKAKELAESRNLYDGGLEDCRIEWIDVSTQFKISQYNGSESLELRDSVDWDIA